MYWQKKKLNYDILIPPITKPFEVFSLNEAEDYFNWFISNLDKRAFYLEKYSNARLDYSVDSLIEIWSWFLKVADIEKTPKEKLDEIKVQLKGKPKNFINNIIQEQLEQFTLETEYVIRDVAMYFGEVIVRNNNSIYWGYHTDIKKDSFANRPLLMGFEDRDFNPPFQASFDPVFTVRGIACNLFDNSQNKNDLVGMYKKWQRMIFN